MKKYIIAIFILLSISIFFAISQKEKDLYQIEKQDNVELAIYINEEETNAIPSKDSGYYLDLEKSICTNNAIIQFDTSTWSPVIKNMSEYKTRCELHFGSTYKETILNGTDPVLEEPLIAVTIDNDGTVRKASLANEWYSYENKEWANAVILFDESEHYEDGEIISEDAIESYFVWIPKYRYQLWDLGQYDSVTEIDTSKVHEIPVIFGDYNTNDNVDGECTTPMESGATGNCQIVAYMTHPAFLSIPSTGFWVGKFETGYNETNITDEAEQNVIDSSKIIVKPNVYSWREIQLANAFYTSYDYQRKLDSHMMKNTEWGAVAYLQHSKYGSTTSVRINNNSNFITGYQANDEPTCGNTGSGVESMDCNVSCSDGTCNTAYPNSVLASTTDNVTGIFDMSGGALEYLMHGTKTDANVFVSGISSTLNSGFKGIYNDGTNNTTGLDWPNKKYYDLYLYTTNRYQFKDRILGDATGEMGPFSQIEFLDTYSLQISSWYNDTTFRWVIAGLWFQRGGAYYDGYGSGIFQNTSYDAIATWDCSFRLILTPTGGTS